MKFMDRETIEQRKAEEKGRGRGREGGIEKEKRENVPSHSTELPKQVYLSAQVVRLLLVEESKSRAF